VVVFPLWPTQAWYPLLQSLRVSEIMVSQPSSDLLLSPFRSPHPQATKSFPGGFAMLRESYAEKGISKNCVETLIASWAVSTRKQYEVAFKRWWEFKGDHATKASESEVLEFLQLHLQQGSSFQTLNSFRSALVALFPELGKSSLIKRFLKEALRLVPRNPRYTHTWDPKPVLDLLGTFPSEREQWTKKLLVCMLLALTSAQRVQTWAAIKVSNIHFSSEGAVIIVPDMP